MSLQFPNARLHIHDLLTTEGLSGPESIARGAKEFGLISSEITVAAETDGLTCPCKATAKKVLNDYFIQKSNSSDFPAVDIDQVWSVVERDLETHKRNTRHRALCDKTDQHNCCQKLAPILFDLILQQVRRYP